MVYQVPVGVAVRIPPVIVGVGVAVLIAVLVGRGDPVLVGELVGVPVADQVATQHDAVAVLVAVFVAVGVKVLVGLVLAQEDVA